MKSSNALNSIKNLIKIAILIIVLTILISFIVNKGLSINVFSLLTLLLFFVLVNTLYMLNNYMKKVKKFTNFIELTEKMKEGDLTFDVDYEINSESTYDKATTNLVIIKDTNERLFNDIENVVLLMNNEDDFSVKINPDYYKGDYKKFVEFLNEAFLKREKKQREK